MAERRSQGDDRQREGFCPVRKTGSLTLFFRRNDCRTEESHLTLAEQIELACLMEATARKPGNVHPAAAFRDLCYDDFVRGANAIAAPLAAAKAVGLGQAIFDAVQANHLATGTNVNLGIVLLLAPLAAVPEEVTLEEGLCRVLQVTTIDDSEQVYAAIRLAQPGGMGEVSTQDISDRPTVTLREAMILAADRDRIAEQYADNFRLVFEARRRLCQLWTKPCGWEIAVVSLYVWMIAKWPDTLIARKCGCEFARQTSQRAAQLVERAGEDGHFELHQLAEFDAWLRMDGHRRNPGTTADLIAATLFASARDGLIVLPSRVEIERQAATICREAQ